MFSLHIDTARTWRGGQNQVLLTVNGLRAIGERAALVAHPGGELRRRAAEGLELIPIAPRTEMDLSAAWRLSRVIKRLTPDVLHAHDPHGVAMAALAMLYGVVSGTSIWYPINLLAVGFFPNAAHLTTSEIAAFHLRALLIAIPIHLITSLLVGLLYGAMLPMLPRRPILLGGFVAPVLWSGLIHSILGIVNPVLGQRIDLGIGVGHAGALLLGRMKDEG